MLCEPSSTHHPLVVPPRAFVLGFLVLCFGFFFFLHCAASLLRGHFARGCSVCMRGWHSLLANLLPHDCFFLLALFIISSFLLPSLPSFLAPSLPLPPFLPSFLPPPFSPLLLFVHIPPLFVASLLSFPTCLNHAHTHAHTHAPYFFLRL